MMIRSASLAILVILAALPMPSVASRCEGFKWDVSRESMLFATPAKMVMAGSDATKSVEIETERLYELQLAPEEQVRLASTPSKKSISDGAFAGAVRFRVAKAGPYRVALSHGFWIDVVVDGKPLPSRDFSGSPNCTAPRKVVVYDLPDGENLILQLTGSVEPSVRLSVTPVIAEPD